MADDPAAEPAAFEGRIDLGDNANVGAPETVDLLTIKFVHYPGTPEFPGSQQLIVWLPTPGYQGYTELFVRRGEGPDTVEVEWAQVTDRLNGSVQILFHTLPWPPGSYVLTVGHETGWHHRLDFIKQEVGAPEPLPEPIEQTPVAEDSGPIVYRDGFGNIIPDQDLIMREAAFAGLTRLFSRKVTYRDQGRSGSVIYTDGERTIEFYHEIAGGRYSWIIDIPTPDTWEAKTGIELRERDDIVKFVAESAQRDQGSTWVYEIRDDAILFRDP